MESPPVETPLFKFLDTLGITHTTYRHPPVFTVEEAQKERAHMPPGGHSKNLFIRNKRKNFALVVAAEDRKIDLKSLGDTIGLGRPSFASAEHLQNYLGVQPGSVTPFALINANKNKPGNNSDATPELTLALDKTLMANDILYFHPLHNGATTGITPASLLRFVSAVGYDPIMF